MTFGLFLRSWLGSAVAAFVYLAVVLTLIGANPTIADMLQKSIVTGMFCSIFWSALFGFKLIANRLHACLLSGFGVSLLIAGVSAFEPNLAVLSFLLAYACVLGLGSYLATSSGKSSKSS